jgi:hypothetical protein
MLSLCSFNALPALDFDLSCTDLIKLCRLPVPTHSLNSHQNAELGTSPVGIYLKS